MNAFSFGIGVVAVGFGQNTCIQAPMLDEDVCPFLDACVLGGNSRS